MSSFRVAMLALTGIALVQVAIPAEAGPRDAPAPDLDTLLPRLARVAGLFRDSVLSFSCKETIAWSGPFDENGRQTFGYVYVHDDEEGFADYRTWGRGERRRRLEEGDYGAPLFLRSAYLWAFHFLESRQDRFRYEVTGTRRVLGRPAVGVRFEPLPPIEEHVNDWYGTAWVDAETTQLLSVEAHTVEDWSIKRAFERHVAGGEQRRGHYDFSTFSTEFGVEKNGMRFPSKVVIRFDRHIPFERRGTWRYERQSLLRVRQHYKGYEFFRVRTADEISRIVGGRP